MSQWRNLVYVCSTLSSKLWCLHCVLQCMKWRREMLRPSFRKPPTLKLTMGWWWCGSEVSPSPPMRLTLLSFFQVLDIIISFFAGHLIDGHKGCFTWLLFGNLHPIQHLLFEFGNVNAVTWGHHWANRSSYFWLLCVALEYFIDYIVLLACCNLECDWTDLIVIFYIHFSTY